MSINDKYQLFALPDKFSVAIKCYPGAHGTFVQSLTLSDQHFQFYHTCGTQKFSRHYSLDSIVHFVYSFGYFGICLAYLILTINGVNLKNRMVSKSF